MSASKFRVMCVDDDLGFRRFLSSSLGEAFDYTFYSLGFECLSKCVDQTFDLILVDATLPDMMSEQLVEQLKAKPELSSTPIVIVSYKNSEKERKRFSQCGCDHFLSKVASPKDIRAILNHAISKAA